MKFSECKDYLISLGYKIENNKVEKAAMYRTGEVSVTTLVLLLLSG